MDAGPDDDGFYAYVPDTVNVDAMVLVATIAVGVFLVATLPFAVMLGEKYEELHKQSSAMTCGSEGREHDESKPEGYLATINEIPRKDTDESSTSSKHSVLSAISGAIKEVMDKTGRPMRGAGHIRNRHRHKTLKSRKSGMNLLSRLGPS
jgi:hypothetical protein